MQIPCAYCSVMMDETARFCPACGQAAPRVTQPASQQPQPIRQTPTYTPVPFIENHLVKAILVTVLCCLPFGIVSIVYANQVNEKTARGDYQGALSASNNADKWANWGMIAAALSLILSFAFGLIGALFS